jgi:hypothetical protein
MPRRHGPRDEDEAASEDVASSMVEAVAAEAVRARLDPSDPLVILAVNVAERIDAGTWQAAEVRELRLTIVAMRQTGTPQAGGDELDRFRRRRAPSAAGAPGA